MRKNVIALMLVLPLLFIFIIYTTTSGLSLETAIAVSSISILGADSTKTVSIDVAENPEHAIEIDVQPRRATDKEYDYTVTPYDENSEFAQLQVVKGESGIDTIVAYSTGMAYVTVTSRSGGLKDRIVVRAYASGTYGFEFFLYGEDGTTDLLGEDVFDVYEATIPSGTYSYSTRILPTGFMSPRIEPAETSADAVVVDAAKSTLLFPFEGAAEFEVTIPNPNNPERELHKTVRLTVTAEDLAGEGFLVNGRTVDTHTNTIKLGRFTAQGEQERQGSTSLYVMTDGGALTATGNGGLAYEVVTLAPGRFRVDIEFFDVERIQSIDLTVGDITKTIRFEFDSFSFGIRTDAGEFEGGTGSGDLTEIASATLLLNTPISFYAVPDEGKEVAGVVYLWDVLTPLGVPLSPEDYAETIRLEISSDGSVCTVMPLAYTNFILRAQVAFRLDGSTDAPNSENSAPYDILPEEVAMSVVRQVTQIQIIEGTNKAFTSLGDRLAIPGNRYVGSGLETEPNTYTVEIVAYDNIGQPIHGLSDLNVTSSDESVAEIEADTGLLTPVGTGAVTVTAAWKGNESFESMGAVSASITFDVIRTAYEVRTSAQIFDASDRSREIVLGADIMLGTDGTGSRLALEERRAMLEEHKLRSTYNTEFYKHAPGHSAEEAFVYYALEFTNNVYGNGYSINAEYFANAVDTTGAPQLFKGPLSLVAARQTASVAAQDNISFLCRTDDVTIYNVELLGCSDASLIPENGDTIDLTRLDNVGTTLELNGNIHVANCTIKNGRTVVRAYGGNRDGSRYFIDSLNEIDPANGVASDRINVTIEGCIITQGREFLVKVGANRALRSGERVGTDELTRMEPLLAFDGTQYVNPNGAARTNAQLLTDETFYKMFVMTDVTLKDSVLETSGLFAVGMESNFAGALLYNGRTEVGDAVSEVFGDLGWSGTGGTSFASVLRLEGDVRIYDWKDLRLVDSSTLIQISVNANEQYQNFKLDIAKMLNLVCEKDPATFGKLLDVRDDTQYVHGGIACYGGGRNYALIDLSKLNEELKSGLVTEDGSGIEYYVNLSVLTGDESDDSITSLLGQLLPYAAGTQDFRFYMYNSECANNLDKQNADKDSYAMYTGVKPVPRY